MDHADDLVPGANLPLPDGALTIRVPGPFDLSALVTGDDGKVSGDTDFVFFNQPTAPGARLDGDTLTVDPRRLRAGATRVTLVVSPADPTVPLARLAPPVMTATGPGTRPVIRFAAPAVRTESVLLLAEVYRRGTGWKLRALGQGYADGLAGLARDFGVEVSDDGAPVPSSEVTRRPPAAASPTPFTAPFAGQSRNPFAPGAGRTGAALAAGASTDPSALAQDLLTALNSARARATRPPLTLEPSLCTAATGQAQDMAARGSLGDAGPGAPSVFHRVNSTGYRMLLVDQRLVSGPRDAAGFVDYWNQNPDAAEPAYLAGEFTHLGVGFAAPGVGGPYWTVLLASPFTTDGLARLASRVRELTNIERARHGLGALSPEPRLTHAAQAHSDDMVARDFYAHTTPDGREPWDRTTAAGYPHRMVAENIACGQRSAAEVVQGWMNSPGHRANILTPEFVHIGVGYATGSQAGTYWTQVFGLPR